MFVHLFLIESITIMDYIDLLTLNYPCILGITQLDHPSGSHKNIKENIININKNKKTDIKLTLYNIYVIYICKYINKNIYI